MAHLVGQPSVLFIRAHTSIGIRLYNLQAPEGHARASSTAKFYNLQVIRSSSDCSINAIQILIVKERYLNPAGAVW